MRNLLIHDYLQLETPDGVESFYFDEFSMTLYYITESKICLGIQLNKQDLRVSQTSFKKDLSEDVSLEDRVIDMTYILELESLVIVLGKGDIIKLSIDQGLIENQGSIENGINAARWSPDQDYLCIATKSNTLLMLDSQFESKGEVPIDDQLGSVLKEDSTVTISWRGDGKFFVVNFQTETGRKCITRDINLAVFRTPAKADQAEDGLVKSVSEFAVKNMQSACAWQPSGSLVANYFKASNPKDPNTFVSRLVFSERNGLQHGELVLPDIAGFSVGSADFRIREILWNKESEIMAVIFQEKEKESVGLFIRSNYKWYLKKNLCSMAGKIAALFWSQTKVNRLLIVYRNGKTELFDFSLDFQPKDVDSSGAEDLGIQASLDNDKLLISVFTKSIIPPPMSLLELKSSSSIDAFWIGNDMIVSLNNDFIEFTTISRDLKIKTLKLKNTFTSNLNRPRQLSFLKHREGRGYGDIVLVHEAAGKTTLLEIALESGEGEVLSIKRLMQKDFNRNITSISQSNWHAVEADTEQFLILQTSNAKVWEYYLNSESELRFHRELPSLAIKLQGLRKSNQEHLVYLSSNQKLYFNDRIVAQECTSFSVSDNFLLFTTNSPGMYHLLYTFDLRDESSPFFSLIGPQNISSTLPKPESNSLNVRFVERGSKILSVVQEKLIFQLPRGNLETIYPRLLVLKKVKTLVHQRNYKAALEALRQHKLDLNILFDLDPAYYLENSEAVMKNVERSDYIGLLLSNLKNELSESIKYVLNPEQYHEVQEFYSKNNGTSANWKINIICDKTIQSLEKINKDKYLQMIMTAHIRKVPSELEYVLEFIRKLKESEAGAAAKQLPPHLNPITKKKDKVEKKITALDVLEYVCWLADANKMFEVALQTYDLELVALVGQQTQKDPKEYIPYLESLKQIDNEIDRKVKINLNLKAYDRCILELSKGEPRHWEYAIELVKTHKLFTYGMTLFTENKEILTKIKLLFADFLISEKNDGNQAALIFRSIKKFDKALDAYMMEMNWKEALLMAKFLNYTEKQIEDLREQLVEVLVEKGNYLNAGLLYMELEMYGQAVPHLVRAGDWANLSKIEVLFPEGPTIRNVHIIPALKLAQNLKLNFLKQNKSEFKTKFDRLKKVQQEKLNMPIMMAANSELAASRDVDASSEMSFASKSSYLSVTSAGGSKRKLKKPKNLSGKTIKEGSAFEEEFLLEVLMDLRLTKEQFNDINQLGQYLVYYDLTHLAKSLYLETKLFIQETNVALKMLGQLEFEKHNENLKEIYPLNNEFKPQIKTEKEINNMFLTHSYLLD